VPEANAISTTSPTLTLKAGLTCLPFTEILPEDTAWFAKVLLFSILETLKNLSILIKNFPKYSIKFLGKKATKKIIF
jgi:hypothetical protein